MITRNKEENGGCIKPGGKTCSELNDGYFCNACLRLVYSKEERDYLAWAKVEEAEHE